MKHKQFKQFLKSKKVSQEYLAENVLFISRIALVNKLGGITQFSIDDIKVISQYFKLTPNQVWHFFFND